MMVAAMVPNVATCDHLMRSENKPCARAIVNGITLAIPLWAVVAWGVRALF